MHQGGSHVGSDRNEATCARGDGLHRDGVLAAVDFEVLATTRDQFFHAGEASSGLLDAQNTRVWSQPRHRVGQQVHAGTRRHVVEDERDG